MMEKLPSEFHDGLGVFLPDHGNLLDSGNRCYRRYCNTHYDSRFSFLRRMRSTIATKTDFVRDISQEWSNLPLLF